MDYFKHKVIYSIKGLQEFLIVDFVDRKDRNNAEVPAFRVSKENYRNLLKYFSKTTMIHFSSENIIFFLDNDEFFLWPVAKCGFLLGNALAEAAKSTNIFFVAVFNLYDQLKPIKWINLFFSTLSQNCTKDQNFSLVMYDVTTQMIEAVKKMSAVGAVMKMACFCLPELEKFEGCQFTELSVANYSHYYGEPGLKAVKFSKLEISFQYRCDENFGEFLQNLCPSCEELFIIAKANRVTFEGLTNYLNILNNCPQRKVTVVFKSESLPILVDKESKKLSHQTSYDEEEVIFPSEDENKFIRCIYTPMSFDDIQLVADAIPKAFYECFTLKIDPRYENQAKRMETPLFVFVGMEGVTSKMFESHFKSSLDSKKAVKFAQYGSFPEMKEIKSEMWLITEIDSTQDFATYRSFFKNCELKNKKVDCIFLTKGYDLVDKFLSALGHFKPISMRLWAYNFDNLEDHLIKELRNTGLSENSIKKAANAFVEGHRSINMLENDLISKIMSMDLKPKSKASKKKKRGADDNIFICQHFKDFWQIIYGENRNKISLEELYNLYANFRSIQNPKEKGKSTNEEAYNLALTFHSLGYATFDKTTDPQYLHIHHLPAYGCKIDDSLMEVFDN
uniref:Uncharacterized protein n=2 Tax=Panagrolaimus sp. JU765 TaxID=591449 RepID=A0AC34PV25_9BILA